MSYADSVFIRNCKAIISLGLSDDGFQVRPKWTDGTPAHTKKLIYRQDRYDLTPSSIPVMTLRKQGIKNAVDEILWIYQRQTSDLSQLHSHIWDAWNVGDGTIGKAYGYQIGKMSRHHKYTPGEILDEEHSYIHDDWVYLTQTDAVIWDLKNNPCSRSIITNMYDHEDLSYMGLRPCAYSMHYIVTKDSDGLVLNGKLMQRSQDMLVANNWNVIQYSVLLQMLAQVTHMKPGKFVHSVSDMHIYDRHIPIVEGLIRKYSEATYEYDRVNAETAYESGDPMAEIEKRINSVPYPNPRFCMNRDIMNFYKFTADDVWLEDYQYCDFNDKIEVAV